MYYYVLVSVLGASLLLFLLLHFYFFLCYLHGILLLAPFFLLYGFRVGFSQGSNCFHLEFVSAAIALVCAMGVSVSSTRCNYMYSMKQ